MAEKLKITLVKSPIGAIPKQRATVEALWTSQVLTKTVELPVKFIRPRTHTPHTISQQNCKQDGQDGMKGIEKRLPHKIASQNSCSCLSGRAARFHPKTLLFIVVQPVPFSTPSAKIGNARSGRALLLKIWMRRI